MWRKAFLAFLTVLLKLDSKASLTEVNNTLAVSLTMTRTERKDFVI
jgi:hypothetical protein